MKRTIETKVIQCFSCPIDKRNCKVENCEKCKFFNGYIKEGDNITGVDCLYDEVHIMHCHVTSFTCGDYLYKSRLYNEKLDGEIEGSDPYDYCQKCCFNVKLRNGKYYCSLRSGVDSTLAMAPFMCYEGEIWTKEKVNEE